MSQTTALEMAAQASQEKACPPLLAGQTELWETLRELAHQLSIALIG